MERSLLKELTNVNLIAYVNRQRDALLRKMFWATFFPLKPTLTLDWESMTGSSGAPVMADVVEYNVSAPLKTRRVVSSAKGDIPKMTLKRRMDEKDLNEYNIYSTLARGDSDKQAILDIVFDDVDFVFAGAMARTEHLAMQALSYGKLTLDTTNNNGLITETDVDFGIPADNKTGVSVVWSDAANATPIQDTRDKVKTVKEDGHTVSWMIMDESTWFNYVATTEVKDAYAYYQGISQGRIAVPGIDGVNAMLKAERLPQIYLVDSVVRHETLDHVLSTIAPWKANYVTLVSDFNIGNFLHGPIAEENSPEVKKIATMGKVGHILTTKWAVLDPFGEYTKAQANAFPTFNDSAQIYMMKTDATSWS